LVCREHVFWEQHCYTNTVRLSDRILCTPSGEVLGEMRTSNITVWRRHVETSQQSMPCPCKRSCQCKQCHRAAWPRRAGESESLNLFSGRSFSKLPRRGAERRPPPRVHPLQLQRRRVVPRVPLSPRSEVEEPWEMGCQCLCQPDAYRSDD
jgi:hypothetical protein